jgi:hypothetical protein
MGSGQKEGVTLVDQEYVDDAVLTAVSSLAGRDTM